MKRPRLEEHPGPDKRYVMWRDADLAYRLTTIGPENQIVFGRVIPTLEEVKE